MTSTERARFWPGRPTPGQREAGAAMMVAVMVITVVAVLCTSTAVLATRSLHAAGDAKTAGVVKDLANAGLAEGVTYLRKIGATPEINAGTNTFPDAISACSTPVIDNSDPTPDWTRASAARIDSGAQGRYVVWIERVAAANGGDPARYRVCAEGNSGEGKRKASAVAAYTPAGGGSGPYAVYGKGEINLQSHAQVIQNMSVYSEHCVDRKGNNASGIIGTDLATGLPAAAHSMEWVLGGNGPDSCQASNSVHDGSDFVDDTFPYDSDTAGGLASVAEISGHSALNDRPWSGSTKEPYGSLDADGNWVPAGAASHTVELFRARWNLPDMLGTPSITALETTAKQQGNYYNLPSSGTSTVAVPDESHAVVFLDFQNHETINLAHPSVTFHTNHATASCLAGKSLIIVVRNADVEGNGNNTLRATLVIKNGAFTKLDGGFTLIGGLFADNGLDLSGNGTIKLDPCAIQNPPPGGTPQVDVTDYVEYDRT